MSTVATILERERCRVSAASPVLYEKSDRVAFVTLNRPCDGNFLTHEMNEALHRVWSDIAVADDVDVTVLTGAGST
jgi:enoyl-CoA hydratase/carnithine racemase